MAEIPLPPEPATWPKPIGIISIAWGSLNIACNACGFIGPLIGRYFMRMAPPEQQADIQRRMDAQKPWMIEYAMMAAGLLIAILLITAGINTVRRKPLGRNLHLAYAGFALMLVAAFGLVQLFKMPEQIKAVKALGGPGAQYAVPSMIGGLVFGMVLGLAYPLFTLIWFAPAKRAAQLDGGSPAEVL